MSDWPEVTMVRFAEHVRLPRAPQEVQEEHKDLLDAVWLAGNPIPWEGPAGYETETYGSKAALRREWEKEQLEAMRSDSTVTRVAMRLEEINGESTSEEEREKLALKILFDLTTPRVLVRNGELLKEEQP